MYRAGQRLSVRQRTADSALEPTQIIAIHFASFETAE
jgi:hypothetical protein